MTALALGTLLLPCQAKNIDIGLHDSINRLYIGANKNFEILEDKGSLDPSSKITLLQKKANDIVLLRSAPETSNLLVLASAPDLISASSRLKIACTEDTKESPCIIQIKTSQTDTNQFSRFRGSIIIVPRKEDFTVINQVNIEDYLKGVIPSEMPASWEIEALKAQAVAARTYTLAKMGRRRSLGYDLKPTVEDQMYLGYNNEHPRSNKALDETLGKFMIDHVGNYVDAYYYSHSGEYSGMPEYIWQTSPKHYLLPAQEPSSDKRTWQVTFSRNQLLDKLSDLRFLEIQGITITEHCPEGRVRGMIITGKQADNQIRHLFLTGPEFRHHLGLASTLFDIEVTKDHGIIISGKGSGHGVGMSQYGAKTLAAKNKNYEEILGYFYKQAKLAELKN